MMRMPGRRWPLVSILYAASCLFSAVVIFLQCADLAEFMGKPILLQTVTLVL